MRLLRLTGYCKLLRGQRIEERIYLRNESLHAPHLLDLEIAQVLRGLVRESLISSHRAGQAIDDLQDMRVARYPHTLLLARIRQLRHNLSTYDAAYVALAETLRAILISREARLLSAPGHSAQIELF